MTLCRREPNQLEKFGAHALFSKLDVTRSAYYRAYTPEADQSFEEDITNHKARVAAFTGQAQDYMHDLERLYQHAYARELIEQTCIAYTTNLRPMLNFGLLRTVRCFELD